MKHILSYTLWSSLTWNQAETSYHLSVPEGNFPLDTLSLKVQPDKALLPVGFVQIPLLLHDLLSVETNASERPHTLGAFTCNTFREFEMFIFALMSEVGHLFICLNAFFPLYC